MVNAGERIYTAPRATAGSHLRVVGEGVEVEPRGSSPIPSPSMKGFSRSRECVPSLNNLTARALLVLHLCGAASLEVGHASVGDRLAIN